MYKNYQKNRTSFIEKILFDNLLNIKSASNLSQSGIVGTAATSTRSCLNLDESQIKQLSTIFSNISYEKIRQTNERLNENERAATCKSSTSIYSRNNTTTTEPTLYLKQRTHSALPNKKPQINNIDPATSLQKSLISNSKTSLDRTNNDANIKTSKKSKGISSSMSSLTSNELPHSNSSPQLGNKNETILATSNQIVIHVCDEARRLKQDFTCPRELLMREMKYFSHNLNISLDDAGAGSSSSESQSLLRKTLDEIDISVHCDINIFDWLMRYVKRNHPYLIDVSVEREDELRSSHEPKLEVNNCISILLSSDFLIMNELVDKCVVFIARNFESVLQIQFAFNGISEQILSKLAACVHAERLDNVYDRKDKLKTKLFQRKIEFLFDVSKLKQIFENYAILNAWKNDKVQIAISRRLSTNSAKANNAPLSSNSVEDCKQVEYYIDNHTSFLYECENDASSLFRCKLCNRFMTKQQSLYLKCQLAILNPYGDYIYLHVPDEKFDTTHLLQCLKDKLKTWQSVYWYLWSLIKSFKCRKCTNWYRLVELNKCRMNENTFCAVHDGKLSNFVSRSNLQQNPLQTSANDTNLVCCCIYSNHMLEYSSATNLYSKSSIVTEAAAAASNLNAEDLLAQYIQYIIDNLEKHKDLILYGAPPSVNNDANNNNNNEPPSSQTNFNLCELVEQLLSTDNNANNKAINKLRQHSAKSNMSKLSLKTEYLINNTQIVSSFFIDSITGKHVSFLDKHLINLIKLTKMNNVFNTTLTSTQTSLLTTTINENTNNSLISNLSMSNLNPMFNIQLDLEQLLTVVNLLDVKNIFNSLNVFSFLRVDVKMKWETQKSTRMNQDNQREDDLKKFREISNYLIKTKLLDEYGKPATQKSTVANILIQQLNGNNTSSMNNMGNVNLMYPGGIYCRVENEWKQRRASQL